MSPLEVKKHGNQMASRSEHDRTQRNVTTNLRRIGTEESAGTRSPIGSLRRRKGMK
jgi:hypothetical protein